MKDRFWALLAAAVAGCAGQTSQTQPSVDTQKVVNLSYFDLANCSPRSVKIHPPVTEAALVGFVVAARPQVLECLVDPKSRGPANDTRAFVDATVDEGRTSFKVTGENLTADGAACIQSALERWTAANPVMSGKGESPVPKGTTVSKRTEFQHAVNVSPAVTWGRNEASDAAGKIRIATKDWCDCFAPWKNKVPKTTRAKLKLTSDKPAAEVTFDPAVDANTEAVTSCLKGKIDGLALKAQSRELTFTYPFAFVHSGIDEIAADAPPELKFVQLEALRGQRAAETAIAIGNRGGAADAYDKLVTKYQAKKDYALVRPMKESCAALLKADDAWIQTLERQMNTEQTTGTLIAELKAQNPQWTEADAAAQRQIQQTRVDLDAARTSRTKDAGSCPKEHF
ncbi:MAG TPA: hypothetical protein VKE49_01220 [Myxococcaceae bacterium]|nr:hypothetical protein [Myxococcaceae bacterium]